MTPDEMQRQVRADIVDSFVKVTEALEQKRGHLYEACMRENARVLEQMLKSHDAHFRVRTMRIGV